MIYLILVIIVYIIFKFIYDSYLTNNTEKNWDKFKKSDPNRAKVIEYSKSFNLNTEASLRTDGYYLAYITGKNYLGEVNTVPVAFIFNRYGLVAQYQGEYADQLLKSNFSSLQKALIEMDSVTDCEITSETSKYKVKEGGMFIRFYDINNHSNSHLLIDSDDEPYEYIEWNGTILHNGLLLNAYKSYFNFELQEYVKEVGARETVFNFTQIKFK